MKKFMSVLLALVMVFTMGANVKAAEVPLPEDKSTFELTKIYVGLQFM